MKTFVYSAHQYEIPYLTQAAEGKHELVLTAEKLSMETATMARGCEAVALFTADDASASVIQKLYGVGVKYIALRSTGYDHVDLQKAKKMNMHVAHVPIYSPYAIAEHAVALLLSLNRRIVEGQLLQRLQDYRLDSLVGFDIHGKTIGVIGTGTIGTAFAKIMKGFGASLLGHDPAENNEAKSLGLRYVSMNELLRKSDIISLHCPLNEHTRHLISKDQFAIMKKGSWLVNTARGGLVNTEYLIDALESGQIGGACLDVYEKEKAIFFENHHATSLGDAVFTRLKAHPNVIVTGHQAFLTVEALKGIAETTIRNLDYWEDGESSPHEFYNLDEVTSEAKHGRFNLR